MVTSATAPQMPSTATGGPHRDIRSRVGKAAPNMTKPVATAPHIQIVSATIGTWSWSLEIRSGANRALSAMASQRPATATAVGSIRPVRWSRWSSWTSSVLSVTTWVAVIRSPSLLDALASTTSWRRPPCALSAIWPLGTPGRKGRSSLDVRSIGPAHLLLALLSTGPASRAAPVTSLDAAGPAGRVEDYGTARRGRSWPARMARHRSPAWRAGRPWVPGRGGWTLGGAPRGCTGGSGCVEVRDVTSHRLSGRSRCGLPGAAAPACGHLHRGGPGAGCGRRRGRQDGRAAGPRRLRAGGGAGIVAAGPAAGPRPGERPDGAAGDRGGAAGGLPRLRAGRAAAAGVAAGGADAGRPAGAGARLGGLRRRRRDGVDRRAGGRAVPRRAVPGRGGHRRARPGRHRTGRRARALSPTGPWAAAGSTAQ